MNVCTGGGVAHRPAPRGATASTLEETTMSLGKRLGAELFGTLWRMLGVRAADATGKSPFTIRRLPP